MIWIFKHLELFLIKSYLTEVGKSRNVKLTTEKWLKRFPAIFTQVSILNYNSLDRIYFLVVKLEANNVLMKLFYN